MNVAMHSSTCNNGICEWDCPDSVCLCTRNSDCGEGEGCRYESDKQECTLSGATYEGRCFLCRERLGR